MSSAHPLRARLSGLRGAARPQPKWRLQGFPCPVARWLPPCAAVCGPGREAGPRHTAAAGGAARVSRRGAAPKARQVGWAWAGASLIKKKRLEGAVKGRQSAVRAPAGSLSPLGGRTPLSCCRSRLNFLVCVRGESGPRGLQAP